MENEWRKLFSSERKITGCGNHPSECNKQQYCTDLCRHINFHNFHKNKWTHAANSRIMVPAQEEHVSDICLTLPAFIPYFKLTRGWGRPVVELKAGKRRYATSKAKFNSSPLYQCMPMSSARIWDDKRPLNSININVIGTYFLNGNCSKCSHQLNTMYQLSLHVCLNYFITNDNWID